MLDIHLIHPVFLDIHHSFTTFNFPFRSGFIARTRERSITESFKDDIIDLELVLFMRSFADANRDARVLAIIDHFQLKCIPKISMRSLIK